MERPVTYSTTRHLVRRAAAAAVLTAAMAARASSQAAGGRGGVRASAAGPRDSFFFQQILPPGVRIDSVMMLVHALQKEAYRSAGWFGLHAKLDSLLPMFPRMGIIARARPPLPIKGWIGVNVGGVPQHEMISEVGDVVRYLAYPPIMSVDPDSPAQHAGIEPGDVLVAYDGIDVVDHDVNLTRLFIPDRKLSVTVRRDGEMKDYSVQIAKLPERVLRRNLELSDPLVAGVASGRLDDGDMGPVRRLEFAKPLFMPRDDGGGVLMAVPPGYFVLAADGLFGARLSTVSAGLARALKLEMGVLVNDVSDGTPAAKAGLRAGDVIVGAAGQPVATMDRLRRVLASRLPEQSIELQLVRDKRTRKVTVTW